MIWNYEHDFPWIVRHKVQYYQLIMSVTKCENVQYTCTRTSSFLPILKTARIYFIRVSNSGEKTIKRTQFSADYWRTRSETVRLQLSNYKKFKLDSCNWIPTWLRYNYVANRPREEPITSEFFVIDTIIIKTHSAQKKRSEVNCFNDCEPSLSKN